jgi:hypothetical protein
MINLKVLSTAAAMALVLPMIAPGISAAQAQDRGGLGAKAGGGGGAAIGGGGGFRGGGGYRHRGGGFWPGVAVGAGIGIGSSYGYYGSPYYADDSYGYYDDSAVAAGPPVGDDDAVAYCTQRYRSYDPASGTYLGNDGLRHPCPAQ